MKLNCDYIFQNYLISDNSRDAIEAVSLAMTSPGQIYNPIFIYGAIGIGKTHLLQALAQEYTPDLKVYYATIEEFINNITKAIQHHRYIDFIEHCLDFDALLIDDIHLVKDKKSTLEELLHIFGRLYNTRKQIIVSADRPPKQIFNTKDKAPKIFQKGWVLKMKPSAYNDRLRFLQVKAQNAGLSLSDDIFEDVAREAHTDFRELEGILAKTKLRHELMRG